MQREPSHDALVDAEVGLARLRQWLEDRQGLRLMLATMPEGATLADALQRHRALRQLGRRPSGCMSPEVEATS